MGRSGGIETSRPVEDGEATAVDEEAFKAVFRRHTSSVAVVAGVVASVPFGFTATSVTSVSARPAHFTFSVAAAASVAPAVGACRTVSVSLLAHDQVEVARRCATRGVDRFAEGDWATLGGDPVVAGAVAWLHGAVVHRIDVASSTLVVARVLEQRVVRDVAGLVHVNRSYHPSP
ncbi:flavin oxidoreductase [Actinotalea ferrariae CF5-4]|uniref:Flavin oxidoreductase n=1 Tax=Actinotalea ferrariae CF5-4 TaxID=948458 RepID=A0A021VNP1_9CELL|nr:flavin reductase family protein [Actinotalea ferrariae]EYR62799.1 flavin oxidoreductase [Actinotalea ferrariae CF5-4]